MVSQIVYADVPWGSSDLPWNKWLNYKRSAAASELRKEVVFNLISDEAIYSDSKKIVGIKILFNFTVPLNNVRVGVSSDVEILGYPWCKARKVDGSIARGINNASGNPSFEVISEKIISPENIDLLERHPYGYMTSRTVEIQKNRSYIVETILKPKSLHCKLKSDFDSELRPDELYTPLKTDNNQLKISVTIVSRKEDIHRDIFKKINYVTLKKYRLSDIYKNNSCVPDYYCRSF
jgi:hypothetical protein